MSSYTTAWDVTLIISNLVFIFPLLKAVWLHRYTRAILFGLMTLASGFYHACKSFSSLCIFDSETLRKCDFFFAQLLILVSALYLIEFPLRLQWVERMFIIGIFPIALFVLQMSFDGELLVQLIVTGVAAIGLFVYWYWYHRKFGRWPRYNWIMFTMAIAMITLAASLFSTQSLWPKGYAYIHSVWHINAALGQYFLLATRRKAPRLANVDTRIARPIAAMERHGIKP
jgi:hypothetical protein